MSSLPSERAAVVATVDPIDGNNTTIKTDAVDLSKFREAMFVLLTGVMASSSTIAAIKLQESATTTDGDFSDISGKTIADRDNDDDAQQFVINIKSDELTSGKRYVRMVATCSAHSILVAMIGLGLVPRFAPGSDDDLSSVIAITA